MAELVMGIKHLRDGIEAQAVLGSDMSVVGLIGTAPGANVQKFPLNTPVLVRTNDSALRLALGTTGTIVDALAGISAQLGDGVGAAKVVVVRVENSPTPLTVIANMIGSEAAGTGVWAFLHAPEDLGVTPRLLIAPGYTSQAANGIDEIVVSNGGQDYTTAPVVSFTGGGGGTGAAATAIVSGGVVTGVVVTNPGAGYTSAPTVVFTGGGGTGVAATASIAQQANAVCALMPTICDRLKARFLPEGPTNSRAAAVAWLETLPRSAAILHPLRQDAKVLGDNGTVLVKPLSPYVIARYVRRDAEFDRRPFHSIANQSLNGLVGVTPTIRMSITDDSAEGQSDLAISFGIVFRGDVGVDGALTDGGFVFWGTDTLSDQSEWLFANVGRGRDYMELMQVKALRIYLGKYNLTLQTVQAIVNTLESECVLMKANNDILDYKLEFDPNVNTPEELRLGHIDLTFRAEEPPVLRKITIRSRRHREAMTALVQSISIALGTDIAA